MTKRKVATPSRPTLQPSLSPSRLPHHPSLKDMASDHIRLAIVAGDLEPGTKVDQDEIAERLGISRLPVREALIELAAQGYVTSVPRRGAFVVRLSRQDIVDHFKVLGALFGRPAGRAAALIDDAQLAALRELHGKITETRDPDRTQALDVDFYRTMNRIDSSDRLLAALQYFALALPNDYYMYSPHRADTEDHYRSAMLEALSARDAKRATKVAEEHLNACGQLTVEALEARGYWPEAAVAAGTR